MWSKKTAVFFVLFLGYAGFSAWVYTSGTEQRAAAPSAEALRGKQVWQDLNCSSCHQVYGLGGYLGPDLTNIISDPRRGKEYAAAFIRSGGATMPNFHLGDADVQSLLAYLSYVDESVKNNTR